MKYFCFLTLFLFLGCKKFEKQNQILYESQDENNDWILGKWKIVEHPFDFFPFDYDDRICSLEKFAFIEFKKDNQMVFSNANNESCKVYGQYSLEIIDEYNKDDSYWLKFRIENKNYIYSINKWSNDFATINSNKFPKYALKNIDITSNDVFLKYEKHGFEIKINKVK